MHRTWNPSGAFEKKIFFVCLLGFALLQIYGMYYSQLRLQFEASSDMVWFSGPGYHTPMYRYAFILNKFLLFPAFWLHLPMKAVGTIYCINDAFFYLGVSFFIIWLTGRYDYSAAVLAAPLVIHGSIFYWIVNEIFLSGSLLILYTAVAKYMEDNWFKNALLTFCAFFIIWSHPAMIAVFLVFFPFIYTSFAQIRKHWPLLLFICINILFRLIVLTDYDQTRLENIRPEPFHLKSFFDFAIACFYQYSHFTIIILAGLYSFVISKSKITYLGLLIAPFLFVCCHLYDLSSDDPYLIKLFYPVTLFILLQCFITANENLSSIKNLVIAILSTTLLMGAINTIYYSHHHLYQRALEIEKLNDLCQQQDSKQSKWFVISPALDSIDGFEPDWHTESMFFSSRDGLHPTIQLVRTLESDRYLLNHFAADKLFLNKECFFPIKSLNPYYFQIDSSPYKELILDRAMLNHLKE